MIYCSLSELFLHVLKQFYKWTLLFLYRRHDGVLQSFDSLVRTITLSDVFIFSSFVSSAPAADFLVGAIFHTETKL